MRPADKTVRQCKMRGRRVVMVTEQLYLLFSEVSAGANGSSYFSPCGFFLQIRYVHLREITRRIRTSVEFLPRSPQLRFLLIANYCFVDIAVCSTVILFIHLWRMHLPNAAHFCGIIRRSRFRWTWIEAWISTEVVFREIRRSLSPCFIETKQYTATHDRLRRQ